MCIFPAALLNAQVKNIVAKDSTAAMQKIADDVYVIIHENASDEWPHGNTGVIVGEDGILVVDACYLPSRAKADIALIRSISSKPVKYLVYTHWHMDHNNGGIEYKNAFPSIQIISERQTAEFIEINSTWWDKYSTVPGSKRIASDKELEDELAIGKDTVTGKPFSPEETARRKKVIAQRQNEKKELADLTVVKPNRVFDGKLILALGKKQIVLRDNGRANSLHDVTIYIPGEKILFTGDLVVQDPLPYVGASYPAYWLPVLDTLIKMNAGIIVPGHGPVMYNYDYINKIKNFFQEVSRRAGVALSEGQDRDAFIASLNLDEYRTGVWQKSAAAPDDDWNYTISTLAFRMWNTIRGQEPGK